MAILPIVITGDPVLHEPAKAVEKIDEDVQRLVRDLTETMHAAPGVGLAAPQVGIPQRIFVWHWEDEDGNVSEGAAINPRLFITPPALPPADEESESEGCLSIPGERFPLRRGEGAILRAKNVDGKDFEIEAHGWLARIFQHEYDHLEGILYADRLEHVHQRALAKVVKKEGWGKPGLSWLPGRDHPEG